MATKLFFFGPNLADRLVVGGPVVAFASVTSVKGVDVVSLVAFPAEPDGGATLVRLHAVYSKTLPGENDEPEAWMNLPGHLVGSAPAPDGGAGPVTIKVTVPSGRWQISTVLECETA